MRRADVIEVIALAKEVQRLAQITLNEDSKVPGSRQHLSLDIGMHTAALRRRSMDLTRALARLRNPWRQ
jgi:hypothetical protein